MDVTCQRCKAEYEFDETLLGEKGTTVKCSTCGHVFRVMPPAQDGARAQLKLRFAKDGSVKNIASLRELQQRIRAGEVSLDDELGREGSPFRRLHDLPELKNFFGRVPEKASARPEPAATVQTPFTGASSSLGPRPETLLGTAPTARPPALREPHPTFGEQPSAEILDAPTVIAPIPEEIRPRSSRGATEAKSPESPAKRTVIGVGPGDLPAPRPNATLGPVAAMARGRGEPEPATRPSVPNEPLPKVTAAGTLVGASARAFGERNAPPPAPSTAAGHVARAVPAAAPTPVAPEPALPVAPTVLAAPVAPAASAVPAASVTPSPSAASAAPSPSWGSLGAAQATPPRGVAPGSPGSEETPLGRAQAAALREPEAPPVRLYVDDDDVPRARAKSSSSAPWLVLGLLVLGVGAWFGARALREAQPDEAAGSAPAPSGAEPQATPGGEAPALLPEQTAAKDAAIAQAEPAEPPVVAPAKPEADKKEAEKSPAKPEKSSASEAREDKREDKHEERTSRTSAEPKDYAEWVTRGDQLSARGEHAAAAKAYEAALALRPTGSEANSGYGFALLQTGRTREALPHFDRAASSGYAEANIGLGDAYRKLGQPSSALEAYRAYLERLPTGSRAAYAHSWIDKLEKGSEAKEAPAAPSESGYRPAGELTEPSAPAPAPEPSAPNEEAAP